MRWRSETSVSRSGWLRWLALMCLAALVAVQAALLAVPAQPAHAALSSWTQIWSDEFNAAANTGANTSNWLYDTGTGYGCAGCPGGWGTGEIETMTVGKCASSAEFR